MNQPTSPVSVERLATYSHEDAIGIAKLLPYLSDSLSDRPIPRQTLETIINSPLHDQFVARATDGTIVGAATASIITGVSTGRSAWLEDFIVDPQRQGFGIGSRLWDALIEWCEMNDASSLGFTSNAKRVGAHKFYKSRGAVIRDTCHFKKDISTGQKRS